MWRGQARVISLETALTLDGYNLHRTGGVAFFATIKGSLSLIPRRSRH